MTSKPLKIVPPGVVVAMTQFVAYLTDEVVAATGHAMPLEVAVRAGRLALTELSEGADMLEAAGAARLYMLTPTDPVLAANIDRRFERAYAVQPYANNTIGGIQ